MNSQKTLPCSIDYTTEDAYLLSSESILVLNNVSDLAIAATYGPYVYLGVPPQSGLAQQDYTANTFGMLTQCEYITMKCTSHRSNHSEWLDCGLFSGDTTPSPLETMFYTDRTMTSNDTDAGIANPYFFGLVSDLQDLSAYGLQVTTANATPAMLCNSTMYEIVYSSVNGTVSRFESQVSNDSVANIAQVTSSFGLQADEITPGYASLLQAGSVAILSHSNTMWPTQMALAYSKVAMAYFAGTVVGRPAIQAQVRTTAIVSRIPAAPLWCLVIANMLFVVIGSILTVFAVMTLGNESKDVQVHLSIAGLVADRFEGSHARRDVKKKEDLFEEKSSHDSVRVGIVKAEEGGYTYSVTRRGE